MTKHEPRFAILDQIQHAWIRTSWRGLSVALGIVAISVAHYITSAHSTIFHEVFKRLYYVPIVVAAVTAGARGGLAASAFSTLLYLPHIALRWHAWPVLDVEQYGEVLIFNVVAIVTGALADRVHAERDRSRDAVRELQNAYAALEARNEERLRIDRLVTIGRIASGIAHEIRNPLGGLLGSLEILEPEFPRAHPKAEFFDIAKREISRLQSVVTEFLEFAQPDPPSSHAVDVRVVVQAAARLARPTVTCRGVSIDVRVPQTAQTAQVDAEQVQRALLNLMLGGPPLLHGGRIGLTMEERDGRQQIRIDIDGAAPLPGLDDVFEPFRATAYNGGLSLATARRLIENQRGSVRAEVVAGRLSYLIDLPAATPHPDADLKRPEMTC